MMNRFDSEALELPVELRSLDAELGSIRYEERPSFGPELEAELAREWVRLKARPRFPVRQLAAAAVVALLLTGVGVPSARASLVRFFGVLQSGEVEAADAPAIVDEQPPLEPAPVEPSVPVVEDVEEGPVRRAVPIEPPAAPAAIDRTEWPEPTLPEVEDRTRAESLVRRNYPIELQRAGVGGSVRLMLWVDSTGSVDFVNLVEGSGVPDLDRAALQVAPSLRFTPAVRRGRAVGTWVEFPVTFLVNEDEVDPLALPVVDPVTDPEVNEPLDLTMIPEWQGEVALWAPVQREAGELLEAAIGDRDVIERLGPIESILAGEPPAGVAPTQWRVSVGSALEDAMVRDPDNPAPLLALARIRRKQGLRTEARALLERGLQRAERGRARISPSLFAELHYQRGTLIKASWLAYRDHGRIAANAFDDATCSTATAADGAREFASSVKLIAWNYLCPTELATVFADGFERSEDNGSGDLTEMMRSFQTAVTAYPEHVGANVEILLALADEGRWSEVLEGSRRFVRASMGHPYGLLLGGLALQRLARSDEAENQFTLALRGLPESEADELLDLRFVVDQERLTRYYRTSGEERRQWEESFWTPLDPILTTNVNERSVEHVARAAYAHLRFGSAQNDPGEVWVRYGRPTDIRVVGENSGVRTEFWDYGGGPDITFSRVGSSIAMDLTTEGRAYVNDLREVFPHRYGAASRTVFALPGQVSRFHGGSVGAVEIQIHTEVPEVLATGRNDTLDLGLFLVDSEGRVIPPATRRRIRAETAPVSLRAPASPDVASVIIEFFNPKTGQAAALRHTVIPLDGSQAVAISDLMVVAPTSAGDDPSRYAEWMEPLTLIGPLETEALGVYFELYESEIEMPWYRLRAEIVDRDTGVVTGVPIRPAGEKGFRPTWDRFPSADGLTPEFVTVALSDVEPGRHTLRVIVDVPEVGAGLVAQRDLDRRRR